MKTNVLKSIGLLLLLLGLQTRQFAQDTSTAPERPDRAKQRVAITLLRAINTAEVKYRITNGSYATWQTLLSSEPKYFDEFLRAARIKDNPPLLLSDDPEILPGWNLRLNVHSDGQGYDVLLRDLADKKCGYAALTDESGVIRQSKSIDCEI